uniref:Uncharacterized protein n=1 Tax=Lactuca sativa TaxID=4236 RepID=A0A9R1VLY9_LACSA|nr:hypothetical protein LSAT_V11C500287720 [Lactuca sativa]
MARIRNSQYHGLNNASGSLEHAFIEKLLLWVFYECPKVELDRGFLFASLIQPFVSQFHIYLRMLPPETIVGPFKPNLIWKPTSPKLSSHVMGKTEENFFYQIIFIFSPRYIQLCDTPEIGKYFHFIIHTPGMFHH